MTHRVRLPVSGEDGAEWFFLEEEGRTLEVPLFDYETIFSRPGLYEQIIEGRLGCRSPEIMARWLARSVRDAGECTWDLRIVDVGAGNGCVGAHLARHGVSRLIGLDVSPQASLAARRDHPGVYDAYLVVDPSSPAAEVWAQLEPFAPNCLVAVASLGPGHLPAADFEAYVDYLGEGSWLAFNLRHDFLTTSDPLGFDAVARRLVADGSLEVHLIRRYLHRRTIYGEPVHYLAVLGRLV